MTSAVQRLETRPEKLPYLSTIGHLFRLRPLRPAAREGGA